MDRNGYTTTASPTDAMVYRVFSLEFSLLSAVLALKKTSRRNYNRSEMGIIDGSGDNLRQVGLVKKRTRAKVSVSFIGFYFSLLHVFPLRPHQPATSLINNHINP
jgi:hypothetical protein